VGVDCRKKRREDQVGGSRELAAKMRIERIVSSDCHANMQRHFRKFFKRAEYAPTHREEENTTRTFQRGWSQSKAKRRASSGRGTDNKKSMKVWEAWGGGKKNVWKGGGFGIKVDHDCLDV